MSSTQTVSFSSAIRWVSFSKYLTMFARVAISMVMARLLAPALYGVVEMAYTFFAFAKLLRGFSINEIIVQSDDLDHRFLSTVYWLNLGICSAATLMLLILSPVAAYVYANPLVGWVSAALALCFLLEGMAEVSSSLLQKEMNFRPLAIREIAEVVVMGGVCISLAAVGFGVWALILGTMVSLVVRNFTLYLAKPFRPSFVFDRERCRSCFGFASQMSGIKLAGYLKQNFDKILLGAGLGASALGIYGLTRKIVSIPHESVSQIVNRTLLARFSKSKDDKEELESLYLRAIGSISLVSFPFFAGIFVLSDPLVRLCFGPEWLEVIPLVPPLALAAAISTVGPTRHRLLIAMGEPGRVFHASLFQFGIRAIAVGSSVWWGLEPLAWSMLVANLIGWYVENLICFRDWPELSAERQTRCLLPSVAASLISLLVGLVANRLISQVDTLHVVQILCVAMLMAGSYAVCVRTLKPAALNDIASIAPSRFRWLIAPRISRVS